MPDSTGFGDYTEVRPGHPGQLQGTRRRLHARHVPNDGPPIYGGRELWGFPKKFAQPSLSVDKDTLVGTLDYGPVRVATGTMGFKHKALGSRARSRRAGEAELSAEDHSPCRWQPAHLRARRLSPRGHRHEGRLDRPGDARLSPHALAPVADLPVREIISATHIIADLTLGLGKVVYDYLKEMRSAVHEARRQGRSRHRRRQRHRPCHRQALRGGGRPRRHRRS